MRVFDQAVPAQIRQKGGAHIQFIACGVGGEGRVVIKPCINNSLLLAIDGETCFVRNGVARNLRLGQTRSVERDTANTKARKRMKLALLREAVTVGTLSHAQLSYKHL